MGYLITGVKDVRQSRVGDTVTSQVRGATEALAGYRDPNPMVFSGIYRSMARTSRICVTRWSAFSSTTRRLLSSRSPRRLWALDSAVGSWGCCTWRSSASDWSASSTWI